VNKVNHYDVAKRAGPGPCHIIPKGPRARRKALEKQPSLVLSILILGALLSTAYKPAAK